MAKIKFKNGVEIEVMDFNANNRVSSNTGTLSFVATFDKRADIEASATAENMSIITVTSGSNTAIYENFNKNIEIQDRISGFTQTVTVTAAKG